MKSFIVVILSLAVIAYVIKCKQAEPNEILVDVHQNDGPTILKSQIPPINTNGAGYLIKTNEKSKPMSPRGYDPKDEGLMLANKQDATTVAKYGKVSVKMHPIFEPNVTNQTNVWNSHAKDGGDISGSARPLTGITGVGSVSTTQYQL